MTDMKHMDHVDAVARADCEHLREKERTYRGSWKKRGGVGAFMMLARKWDRLEGMLGFKDGTQYNIFAAIEAKPGGEDGSPLAEVRDLRRYLLLVEAEMVARGVVPIGPELYLSEASLEDTIVEIRRGGDGVRMTSMAHPRTVPVHAVGDPDPMLTGNPEAHDYEGSVRPVPLEDSNRHADRALRDGLNSYEWGLLPLEDQRRYRWDDHRQEYRLA